MAFLVGGANSASGGYEISNSLRFNNNDTAYLNRTRSSQSNTTATFSVWTKMGHTHNTDHILFGGASSDTTRSYVYFSDPNGAVGIFSETSDSTDIAYASNGIFKDSSAWYHVVLAIDTTDGTAGNRFKMYINGTQYTDWATATAPSQNAVIPLLGAAAQTVGGGRAGGSIAAMAEGYMADCYYIDGQQKAASDFGETDDNGVWIPKKYTGTYGTNGFKLEFQQTGTGTASASTIGADTSGEDNHLTSNNLAATDVTVDTPTNNFATLMPTKDITLAEGNLVMNHNRSYWDGAHATIGVTSGKWYWEHRIDDSDGDDRRCVGGIVSNPETYPHIYDGRGTNDDPTDDYGTVKSASPSYMYTGWATNYIFDGTDEYNNTWVDVDDNDVLSFALDLDNDKFFIALNGTWIAADGGSDGDPAAGSNETFGISAASTSRVYFPAALVGWSTNTSSTIISWNFGNPSFAISSGNADGNGYGNFEYAPPSGFYSLCTKNLAEYG